MAFGFRLPWHLRLLTVDSFDFLVSWLLWLLGFLASVFFFFGVASCFFLGSGLLWLLRLLFPNEY